MSFVVDKNLQINSEKPQKMIFSLIALKT